MSGRRAASPTLVPLGMRHGMHAVGCCRRLPFVPCWPGEGVEEPGSRPARNWWGPGVLPQAAPLSTKGPGGSRQEPAPSAGKLSFCAASRALRDCFHRRPRPRLIAPRTAGRTCLQLGRGWPAAGRQPGLRPPPPPAAPKGAAPGRAAWRTPAGAPCGAGAPARARRPASAAATARERVRRRPRPASCTVPLRALRAPPGGTSCLPPAHMQALAAAAG